jgi:uncharacterized protein YidB (DUF937 family)
VEKHLLREGGAQGLFEQSAGAGLEDRIASWIVSKENQPISPDEVKRGIDSERLSAMARDEGETEDGMAARPSRSLPKIVNRPTPDGQMPSLLTTSRGIKRFF